MTVTTLTVDERAALVLHLGLDGHPARDYDAIGTALGITRERARQLVGRTLAKLRYGLADAYPGTWKVGA